jgi:CheY-like chemotaxis protein/two-component sensor histidine kinase
MIERQVAHMVRLIDELLDVSRITTGKLRLHRERVELAAVLAQAMEASRPLAECAGKALSMELPPDPIALDADPVRLVQVVSNLLNNACKFTDQGGRIHLGAGRIGDEAFIEVEDTGIGIAPELLPHIFDMFSQVQTGGARSQDGLGIGLSLARALVEMHDGRIEARSAGPGKGSTFTVWLPLAATAPRRTATGLPRTETRETPPVRILAVDDNEDVVESLALLLRMYGHEVETARDGLEALAAAERFNPDLVLLDLGMPGLDGYGACKRLREQPWSRDMTIVALTGWGQDADRLRTTAAGFDDHLVKPVDPAALCRLLAQVGAHKV